MASVVRKAGTVHGKCWMTLRAGVVEMGRSSKAECQGMYLGSSKQNLCGKLGAHEQGITKEEKSLDVLSNWRMTVGVQCDAAWRRKRQPQNTSGKGFPAEKGNRHVSYTRHWSDLVCEWSFSSIFEKGKHKQEQVAERAAGLIIGLTEKSLQEIAYVEWEKENRGCHCSS